ncbi:hypothetical protein ELE36_00795 [Pseudolysobacter antarcticus]|uniref:Uncharacterized protein n=1 Tax=Pseudolysobacter antarcticus TaxID=2511995 RepID=A0A411HEX0_9GAMM|nr:hypothetical protein [Pseudolysobacter antarcticus]QBB69033.1 hypothetical protein ELE36_00795 [Pseudolysobacter antarcticus]
MDDPHLRDSVADSVYRKQNSHYERAQMGTLPKILPEWLPDNVILDTQTQLLWWNGLDYGAHPFVNRYNLIEDYTIKLDRQIAGPKGPWRFELAKLADIEKLAALDAALPAVRRNSTSSSRYPGTLKPFLQQIGLDKVAEKIPESSLSFVWTSDVGLPIRRCHTLGRQRCLHWYDENDYLGQTAVIASANRPTLRSPSGNVWRAPEPCPPNQCFKSVSLDRYVFPLCQDPKQIDGRHLCVSDAVLGMWQAPGIYRSAQLKNDRFFAFDLAPLQ